MVEPVGVASLDAKMSVIHLSVGRTANSRNTIVGDLNIHPAADTAVTARGLYNASGGRASMRSISVIAPVGQWSTQAPQETQGLSAKRSEGPKMRCVEEPRPSRP